MERDLRRPRDRPTHDLDYNAISNTYSSAPPSVVCTLTRRKPSFVTRAIDAVFDGETAATTLA